MPRALPDPVLSRQQLESLVGVLQAEHAAHPISPWQRRCFVWFEGAGISLLLCIAIMLVVPEREVRLDAGELAMRWLHGVTGASMLMVAVTALMNVKLMLQTARQWWIAVRTGGWKLTSSHRQRPRWLRTLWMLPRLAVAIIAALILLGATFVGGLADLVVAAGVMVLLAALPAFVYARRRLDRLSDLAPMIEALSRLEREQIGERIVVPGQVFLKAVDIEDRYLARQREAAMATRSLATEAYSILYGPEVRAVLGKLPDDASMAVRQVLERIAARPQDLLPDTERVGMTATYVHHLASPPLAITYEVHPAARRVTVRHLGQPAPAGSSKEEAP